MFYTQEEIYRALLDGYKIIGKLYCNGDKPKFIQLVDGMLKTDEGRTVSYYFTNPTDWEIYEESKIEQGPDFLLTPSDIGKKAVLRNGGVVMITGYDPDRGIYPFVGGGSTYNATGLTYENEMSDNDIIRILD